MSIWESVSRKREPIVPAIVPTIKAKNIKFKFPEADGLIFLPTVSTYGKFSEKGFIDLQCPLCYYKNIIVKYIHFQFKQYLPKAPF